MWYLGYDIQNGKVCGEIPETATRKLDVIET